MFKKIFIDLCNQNHISPSKVCRSVGIAPATFSCWTDESVPRRATLQRIADYFGVTTAYLLGETEAESKPSFCDAEKADPSEEELLRLWRRIPPEKRTMVMNIILAALKED